MPLPASQVDCTTEVDLCRSHFIQGFPSLRVFRKGHDDIYIAGVSRAMAKLCANVFNSR
jgi:hypothetical protein